MKNMLRKMSKETRVKSAIIAGGMVLCGAGIVFYVASRPADKSFVSFGNLPQGAVVESFLQTKKGTKTLTAHEAIIDLPLNLESAIAAPYRISSSVRMPDETYRDFIITVSSGKIDVTADGFNPRDTVSLTLNGSDPNWTPTDWSGKIEKTAKLPQKKDVHACVDVDNGTEKLSLCHTIKKGWVS